MVSSLSKNLNWTFFYFFLVTMTAAHACSLPERDLEYPPTLYQLAQLTLQITNQRTVPSVKIKFHDHHFNFKWEDEVIERLRLLDSSASIDQIVDRLYATIPTQIRASRALFEPSGKLLIKTCCCIEMEAKMANKIVLWRFSSAGHFPKSISYSRGLFSGFLRDGTAYYMRTTEFPKGSNACTYIYFANCEFARRIVSGDVSLLYEEFKTSFPAYCANRQKNSCLRDLEKYFADESSFISTMENIMKDIESTPRYFVQYQSTFLHFRHGIFECFKMRHQQKMIAAQNGELLALILTNEQFQRIKQSYWSYPDDAVLGVGEYFHPKILDQIDTQLINDGAEKIVIFKNGRFLYRFPANYKQSTNP
jgi:hypothetical protein